MEVLQTKEKNFISAVVYLQNCADAAVPFLKRIQAVLSAAFEQYEIICVEDACTDKTAETVREYARGNSEKPLTLIHMSLKQGRERCMTAGLDMAIGDYVFEFDTLQLPCSDELLLEAYRTAVNGSDVVCVGPGKEKIASSLFYRVFNRFSNSRYPLATDAFRVLSRRAINRVRAQSAGLVYRKAAYAASGLRMSRISFEGSLNESLGSMDLAADSLALYTDAGYKGSLLLTVLMLLLALGELAYTLIIWLAGSPVEGWVTTMFVLTLGFTGLFAVMAICIKYLSLILRFSFSRREYLPENVEKFQK